MKEISLGAGHTVLVDDSDFEAVASFRWRPKIVKTAHTFRVYAIRSESKKGIQKTIRMHRFIFGKDCPKMLDHRDHNGLNNQRSNLRPCNGTQNQANRRTHPGTSAWRGVFWNSQSKKWTAQIAKNGKSFHLGMFNDESKAAEAYNSRATELFGDFASLNVVGTGRM